MNIFLGTQGWSYRDWVGPFYPPHIQSRDYLSIYSQVFDAVELDSTFYGTPRPAQVDRWRTSTPDHFQFTAKVPRTITHDRRLVDATDDMTTFLQSITRLQHKLGAVLIQLPPDFTSAERPALERFLARLPHDVPFATEFRHRSWLTDETYDLLRGQGIATAITDLSYMPVRVEVTSPLAYVRWLGDHKAIQRLDTTQVDRRRDLDRWAAQLDRIALRVQRIYGFANNHYSGHSPADIRYLQAKLGLPVSLPQPETPVQGRLL